MSEKQPHLFCFGLGYTGLFLSCYLLERGWKVSGTVRDLTQISMLRGKGINACVFDTRDKGHDVSEFPLDQATHILSTISPGVDGDQVSDLLRESHAARWIGYISTTGVYGNTGGQVVDEAAPLAPSVERSRRRVDAEMKWRALYDKAGKPVHIFRLPSIYGPGRSAFDQYRENRLHRIDSPGHLFNRVHVDDIVQTLYASMLHPNPGAIYNITDDCPAEPSDVASYACQLMGVEPPPLVPFDEARNSMSPMALSFWMDDRCVSNERMKRELGVKLVHPDYRSGLKQIWQSRPQDMEL